MGSGLEFDEIYTPLGDSALMLYTSTVGSGAFGGHQRRSASDSGGFMADVIAALPDKDSPIPLAGSWNPQVETQNFGHICNNHDSNTQYNWKSPHAVSLRQDSRQLQFYVF